MVGEPVQERGHVNLTAVVFKVAEEDGGGVGLCKDRLFQASSDFSLVDVECGYDIYVSRAVGADVAVNEAP